MYVVKSGDTLSRIAKAHGTTIKALKTANHLSSDCIFVGEKLKLSQAKSATANPVHS
jgi:peptidoglycan endopeptidase LytE